MKTLTLKELREKKNITTKEASKKLEISQTYLYLLENGQRNPSDKLKNKMSKLYNVSVTTIFLASQVTKC